MNSKTKEGQRRLLLVSQVYIPDPAAVGQYMAEVAEEMVLLGWEVTVLTSNRGYDDPADEYPVRETIRGVRVRRLRWSSFGKKTIVHRLIGQVLFCVQVFVRSMVLKRPDAILVTTSPPMGGVVGWLVGLLRGSAMIFWGMDLNPDQAIAQGVVTERSLGARIFNWFNRRLLSRADAVVVLDRFMAARLERKADLAGKLHVIPPWPMEGYLERVEHEENPFRKKHGLEGKFVFMYSGNHSPVHPLDTILEASKRVRDDDRVRFLFVGGGKGKAAVEEFIAREKPSNLVSLPYQPLSEIKYSLSAADVHLVSIGEPMVGCVHPCKFYGAMALAKPILLLGPVKSHVGDLLATHPVGWQLGHGEVDEAEGVIRACAESSEEALRARGALGRQLIEEELSKEILCGRFCAVIESATSRRSGDR